MYNAAERYQELTSNRAQFLNVAIECARLTLPYLMKQENDDATHHRLIAPWQSIGAKCVSVLAAKLMLALLPPQTSFFKLEIDDAKLGAMMDPEMRSDLDLGLAKAERMVMDAIAGSNDRVVIHQVIRQLIVSGNGLIYMGKDGLKAFPLNRFVVERDGDGNVLEIVTKELIAPELLGDTFVMKEPNPVSAGGGLDGYTGAYGHPDIPVYTHVKYEEDNGRWSWYQQAQGQVLKNSKSTAPKNASPWLVLRFNTFDGEVYGRGRVEEYLGDFKSLEALSQALVEGSAAAAKVVFLVNPSSTTKPQTIAAAGNGAIVQGRPDDVSVIQVGKTADFRTAYEMANSLSTRLSEAFLILNVRQSERTTAEEVRLTQMELEQQLGGLFSLLTVEFLKPYLDRYLMALQRSGRMPKLPKGVVKPTIVAGVNAIGRGQDRESLITFITTLSQTLGPEAAMKYVNVEEYIKRLATAQGIDVLNLVKGMQEVEEENAMQQEQAQQMELTKQAGQMMSAPMADPTKNPNLREGLDAQAIAGAEDDGSAG
ncbi:MAG: hypothetical protein CME45_08720 [Halieaceae bacterium]|nr:hypothetical protein [Halieaceae bacterium]